MMEQTQTLLESITELSHEFGTPEYVRGGGGNTSVKTQATLWVKPSGTTLAGLTPRAFVGMDRQALGRLYQAEIPEDPSAREVLVKRIMEQAVLPGSSGRASVEAPLHDSLDARYVVHTHPALVNGMTCSRGGRRACADLFPEALWLDYIDPGFTLCMEVRGQIQAFKSRTGEEPGMIFLKNHGVFVAGATPEAIRAQYALIFERLQIHYQEADVALTLPVGPLPCAAVLEDLTERISRAIPAPEAASVRPSGPFAVAEGPVSPDHIVYGKSYAFTGEPADEAIRSFFETHGYWPRVLAAPAAVFGAGASDKRAALALEMALDGALVRQLAAAFGGIEYMTDRARRFIENWEVESYRSKQL